MSELVLTDLRQDVAIITLNRPERHNSLIPALLEHLLVALHNIPTNIRAVTLLANGRSFSTGGDVLGFHEHRSDLSSYASYIVGLLNETILTMLQLPQPIVTAVHGIVTGGSMGLVLASDIVLASPKASFTPFYAVVGFSPDGGWSTLLPQVIGRKRTANSILCNHTITVNEAVDWGIINRIVPQDKIRSEAVEVAESIAEMKPSSIQHIKQTVNHSVSTIAAGLEIERKHFVEQIVTSEAMQGIEDFLST